MRRLLVLLLLLVACGGLNRGEPTTAVESTRESEIAPDFTLELGDGGTFTLSEETRPVYLLFWAEW